MLFGDVDRNLSLLGLTLARRGNDLFGFSGYAGVCRLRNSRGPQIHFRDSRGQGHPRLRHFLFGFCAGRYFQFGLFFSAQGCSSMASRETHFSPVLHSRGIFCTAALTTDCSLMRPAGSFDYSLNNRGWASGAAGAGLRRAMPTTPSTVSSAMAGRGT